MYHVDLSGVSLPKAYVILQNEPIMCVTSEGKMIPLKSGSFNPVISMEEKTFRHSEGGVKYMQETWDFR